MRIFFRQFCVFVLLTTQAFAQENHVEPRAAAGGISFTSANQFSGSVASGEAALTPLTLTLDEAIERGLKTNLGLLVRGTESNMVRAERVRVLSDLLPKVSAALTQVAEQINLATFGFTIPNSSPIIGPFAYSDIRASATVPVFDWTAWKNLKVTAENAKAAQLSLNDGRDLVVQTVAAGYLAILAAEQRVEVAKKEVEIAAAAFGGAHERHIAGVSPAIEELRAEVRHKQQMQRVLIRENELEKAKLSLARAIGLPAGQAFNVVGKSAYVPLEGLRLEDLARRAYQNRADYQSAQAQLRSAEMARQAVTAQRYPTFLVSGGYGDIGPTFAESHGTFSLIASLRMNLFDGGKIRSEQMQSDSVIERRKAELTDMRGRIDFEVRSAFLDLATAAQQMSIAQGNVDLAQETLRQAEERVAAGVTNNLEALLAQDALATANEDLVNAMYSHNLAKVGLARAVGSTEAAIKEFLGSGR